MRKVLFFVFSAFLFSGCSEDIELKSAVRQEIIPGVPTANKTVKFAMQWQISSEEPIQLDSVFIVVDSQKMAAKFSMQQEGNGQLISATSGAGLYEIIVQDASSERVVSNENAGDEKVQLYFSRKGKTNFVEVSEFKKERKTLR
ncbi:MAG: PBP1b-binding outer membrane lipoprotein LpoB [Sphingobacteriales bacterium]|jgi:PBP1b-binding outer membrane lipoprotein LpoB